MKEEGAPVGALSAFWPSPTATEAGAIAARDFCAIMVALMQRKQVAMSGGRSSPKAQRTIDVKRLFTGGRISVCISESVIQALIQRMRATNLLY